MALGDILVYFGSVGTCVWASALGGRLARRHQSRLTGLYAWELSPVQRLWQTLRNSGRGQLRPSVKRIGKYGTRSTRRLSGMQLPILMSY
jgi:hypothetical protein